MSEQQYLWAPTPDKPKRGRVWLIVVLSVVALLIVGGVLWLFLRPGALDADPAATTSPSASASATPAESATPSMSPTLEPTDDPTAPVATEPPIVDPTMKAFRGQVSGWLGDAGTGLDIIAGSSGQDALPVVETLQQDAQRLSDAQPPAAIMEQWYGGVGAYSQKLQDLHSTISGGSGVAGAMAAVRTELTDLKSLVGL